MNNEISENRAVEADIVMDHEIQVGHDYSTKYWKLVRDVRRLSENDDINNVSASWKELLDLENCAIFKQLETPLGNNLLHIATEHGNELLVKEIVRQVPYLLTAKNFNGDTALHVAAKAGHLSAVETLIDAAHFTNSKEEAQEKILEQNNNGNTFFHEALINGHEQVIMNFLVSDGILKEVAMRAAWSMTNKENKSCLYLAIEAGYRHVVQQAFTKLIPEDPNYVPQGKPLLLAAIVKQNDDILEIVLKYKPGWIHLRDDKGRVPLHYAASKGYLKGVQYLLRECGSCVLERDNEGYFPIHLASYADHVQVVQELLNSEYCPDPRDILDNGGRNILHIAVESGKPNVVKYILQSSNHGLQKIINEQDRNGNTPLHLANLFCHPKIVHALTWDRRVDLTLVNKKGQTALDALDLGEDAAYKQLLAWIALISAGARHAKPKSLGIKSPPERPPEISRSKSDYFKERSGTLMLVSTLIFTVTFASGFTIPGGTKSSGMAVMLHKIWFHVYIFCTTISMYGAIIVTLILISAQMEGDIFLKSYFFRVASYLLGITLGTSSIAFLAAVHLVISDLTWLATTSLLMGYFFIFMLLLLFIYVFYLPSMSRNPVVRYISYYPFLITASLLQHYESKRY